MGRWLRTVVVLSAACAIWPTAPSAECVSFGPYPNWAAGDGFVFDGTVVYLKQTGEIQVAQMRVHRVFKGHLPPHIEVYHRPNIEMAPIRTGQRYVMPITRMNPSLTGGIPRRPFLERTDDPSLVWATAGCGGELRHILKQRGQLDGFGPGWPPTR
jgi:hypothetical protein